MPMNRRHISHALAVAALALTLPQPSFAQAPKLLRILVGYAPGGAADSVARAIGEGLRDSGYSVVIENKPGAGGRMAAENLLTVPPDGSTLILAPLGNLTIYPHIYRSLRYDPLKDFVPVASAAAMSFGIAVGSGSPAKTLKDYLALAKKDSAFASFGTPGSGTQMHFLGAMLGRQADVSLLQVPYKGGSAAVTDAIGGSLPAVITTLPNLLPMHRAGKLRILAITNPEPLATLPGVPTFKTAGFPQLQMTERFAFFARTGTPAPIVSQLNEAIGKAVTSPSVTAVLQKVEFEPSVMSSEALAKQIRSEYAAWGQVVKSTGYSPEE
jgi:tripartite-type tricarboxylate transporter receptor subunit TctC